MKGRRRGTGRIVGMLAVMLWAAPGLVAQAADESTKSENDVEPAAKSSAEGSSETALTRPRISDYLRAASAARARTRAAAGESSVISNADLPDLYYVDRVPASNESLTPPNAGGDDSDPATPELARRSEQTPPAPQRRGGDSSEKRERATPSRERFKLSIWKQRMAGAESKRRTAEQRVAELERERRTQGNLGSPHAGDEPASAGGAATLAAELAEARKKLAEARSEIRRLDSKKPKS